MQKHRFWLEVAWQSSSRVASFFFFFWFTETIFQKATNRASLSFSTQIPQSLKLSLSLFSQLGVPCILFSHHFPAESLAVNGSYSQYGLMMGVSG